MRKKERERERETKEGRERGRRERKKEGGREGGKLEEEEKEVRLVILNFALEHYYFESNPDILFILESSRRHS